MLIHLQDQTFLELFFSLLNSLEMKKLIKILSFIENPFLEGHLTSNIPSQIQESYVQVNIIET